MNEPRPELHRPVVVDELAPAGRVVHLEPTPAEREAIAERLGLVSLDSLGGDVSIVPAMGRQIRVDGTIRAEIVQNCVVTGEPLNESLSFRLDRLYAEDADVFDGLGDEEDLTDPEDDGPDPIVDGKIDVGEAAVEELALQIPPYPRKPGATFADLEAGPTTEEEKPNPFAALAELKKKMESED